MYIVRCRDGSLYTGITTDVERRLEQAIKALTRDRKLALIAEDGSP